MHGGALEPVAIVGMGCRFPGAGDPQQFWKFLRAGRQSVGDIPANRWNPEKLCDPDPSKSGKIRSWQGGFLDEVDGFDWRAWRMLPREVRYMDPQHRLLLEVAWEAIEDAGYPLEALDGSRTSVVVGSQWNDFFRMLARDWSRLEGYAATGNPLMFAANRISYAFGLRGPSLAMDCGCASGLAAVQTACQHLWLGEAELALAGAVELVLSPDSSIAMTATGMLSKAGRCRTLDDRADGFVRSEGAGVIVLKPVAKLEPGDRLYAVVRGIALNHNGRNEWIMASSAAAQQEVIETACRKAGIDLAEVDYVELHGTGNPKGDPIEIGALAQGIGGSVQRQRPCFIGSVKTNLGHLGPASGMASLIKVALSLYHRELPPTLGPEVVHGGIDLDELGLAVADRLQPWPRERGVPTAGVTALSLGGVNAHALLQAPLPSTSHPKVNTRPLLLPLSARSPEALAEMKRTYSRFLREAEDTLVAGDICFTAGVRRTHHEYRFAVIGGSCQEWTEVLEGARDDDEAAECKPMRLIWTFGDCAAGTAGAWNELFRGESACRDILDRCERIRRDLVGVSPGADQVAETVAVFARQVALAVLWRRWGILPDALVTTDSGRVPAACAVGVLGLEEGIQLALASLGPSAETDAAIRRALERTERPVYVYPVEPEAEEESTAVGRELVGWLGDAPCVALEIGTRSGLWDRVRQELPDDIRVSTLALDADSSPGWRDLLALLARLYEWGFTIDWRGVCPDDGRVTSLPVYPWQRQRLWPDWLDVERISTPPEESALVAAGSSSPPQPERQRGLRECIREAVAKERLGLVLDYVHQQVAQVLRLDSAGAPAGDSPLTYLGLDSLSANELKARVEFDLEISLPVAELFQGATIRRVATYVLEQLELNAALDALSAGRDGADTGNDDGSVEVIRL